MGVTVAWCDGVVLQLSQISSAATFSIVCELTQKTPHMSITTRPLT
jgi:hypothetical protein